MVVLVLFVVQFISTVPFKFFKTRLSIFPCSVRQSEYVQEFPPLLLCFLPIDKDRLYEKAYLCD